MAETVATVCGDGGPKGFWLGMAAAAAVTGLRLAAKPGNWALTGAGWGRRGGEAEGWEPLGDCPPGHEPRPQGIGTGRSVRVKASRRYRSGAHLAGWISSLRSGAA